MCWSELLKRVPSRGKVRNDTVWGIGAAVGPDGGYGDEHKGEDGEGEDGEGEDGEGEDGEGVGGGGEEGAARREEEEGTKKRMGRRGGGERRERRSGRDAGHFNVLASWQVRIADLVTNLE